MTLGVELRPAGGNPGAAAKPQAHQAATQFEALLLEHLLRTMREANQAPEDQQGGISGSQTYLEIAEQQLAQLLAERGALGIARLLQKSLGSAGASSSAVSADKIYGGIGQHRR